MINRHTPLSSTAVLVQEQAAGPGNESEDRMASNCLQAQGPQAARSANTRQQANNRASLRADCPGSFKTQSVTQSVAAGGADAQPGQISTNTQEWSGLVAYNGFAAGTDTASMPIAAG